MVLSGAFLNSCGTSDSSPLLAGIEAHATAFARALPGAEAFYSDPGAVFDVTEGENGATCEVEYFCHAEPGYDGPTGVGAPNGPLELTTLPPLAETYPASTTGTATTLNGVIDPQGVGAHYHFEYGTTTGSAPACRRWIRSAGSGSAKVEVSEGISGLQPDTTYHYRLVAVYGDGETAVGKDRAFRTVAPSVTSVSPDTGTANGGTSVTITGTDFVGVTAVKFGSAAAKNVTVNSATSISATSPAGSGIVDVTVTTEGGFELCQRDRPLCLQAFTVDSRIDSDAARRHPG